MIANTATQSVSDGAANVRKLSRTRLLFLSLRGWTVDSLIADGETKGGAGWYVLVLVLLFCDL